MKIIGVVTNPEDMNVRITIEMPLRNWIELQKQLVDKHPSWELGSTINSIIYKMEQTFYDEKDLT